jgi:hypothetical protein
MGGSCDRRGKERMVIYIISGKVAFFCPKANESRGEGSFGFVLD